MQRKVTRDGSRTHSARLTLVNAKATLLCALYSQMATAKLAMAPVTSQPPYFTPFPKPHITLSLTLEATPSSQANQGEREREIDDREMRERNGLIVPLIVATGKGDSSSTQQINNK